MVDVNVDFVLNEEEPVNANFELQPDVTYTADITVETGTNKHNDLYNRELPDQHPMSAITGLESALSGLGDDITAEENRAKGVEEDLASSIDSNHQAISNHVSDRNNPHQVTKAQVGLGNVDNTSDADKPISTATQTALGGKVDKTNVADKVYGTDSSGNQTTYNVDSFGKVDDVKVAGTSVVTNKVANLGSMASETASDYYTSAQVDTALSAKQDNLSAGTGIDITSNTVSVADPTLVNNGTGVKALAVGKTSQSTAEGGVAVGYGAQANSTYGTAVGYESRASNTNTTALGKGAKATQARAIAIGSGAEANAQDAIAIKGVNNTANTFQVYTYNMLDMATGLIPDARISNNIARTSAIPTVDQVYDSTSSNPQSGIAVASAVSGEAALRQNADNGLQNQIDAITASSDVKDIVGTYAELQAYDTSTLGNNDIVKVLQDENENNETTYYRWVITGGVGAWVLIGAEGPYYTISSANATFVPQTTEVNGHALSGNITLTASDVGALPDSTVIPTVNDATLTIQKNSTTVGSFTANQATNATIDLSIPTDTSDLTNGAGFITGITSSDVTTALGYTPYNSSNPSGYISSASVSSLTDVTLSSLANGEVLIYNSTSQKWENGSVPTPTVDQTYDGTSANAQSGVAIAGAGFLTATDISNMVTTNTAQDISAKKTFLGEKAILFKQNSATDKLGFTLYTSANSELGALEYRPNTIGGNPLLNLNSSQSGNVWLGFRYWSNINIIAPKPSNGNYYIPVNITDGNTTVTANNAGTVDISSLLPPSATVDQTYDPTSANAQSGVAINGAGFLTGITSGDVTTALGYTPYNSTNPSGYISGITSGDVTTALGYTPYDSDNPDGFITATDISNMVTTDTTQTISGAKSFTSGINVTALNPYSSISTGTKGTAPSGNLESRFRFYDSAGSASNANCLGGMRVTYYSDGKIATQLQAYKPEAASTVFESIQVIYPETGDPYTYAPASDVVDSIVTTTYIYKNNGNIRVSHGNGLKIVTAAANNITGSSEYTWNYGVTFSDTPKVFVTRRSSATATTGIDIFVRGTPGTSSCKIYNTGSSGSTYTWHMLAIGY